MRPAPGRAVRAKKLNPKTQQSVLREDQLESADYESLLASNKFETGVEKTEEGEYHLQAALAGNATGEKDGEIPAPPAEESADVDYDTLYSLVFDKPATYIRFSQTVEECTGCQYNMTTEDDTFLTQFNRNKTPSGQCSEDDFEKIMEVFEETADLQAPFAAVDNTVIPFETMKTSLKQQVEDRLNVFAKEIYEYWRNRRQEAGNNALQITLKFETHQDNDDADPYVCFRRREVRQTRKTRARDVQSTDKLRKLRKELEDGRQLIFMSYQRELSKRDLLKAERMVYEQRALVKDTKVRSKIKTDDEDLINQKPQKRKMSDYQPMVRQPGTLRIPGSRVDGRPIDADLVLLSDVLAQKENLLQLEIEDKSHQHQKWNENFVDLTRDPLSPVQGHGPESAFRPATAQYQYLMTPPSSVTSESFDQRSPTMEKPEPLQPQYKPSEEETESHGQPAYRRRIGRCGRLWIDRRGLPSPARGGDDDAVSDRWKFDQDDDEIQPVYEVDPYDTDALRFRATIPLPNLPTRPRLEGPMQRGSGPSPNNNRAAASASQPLATS